MDINIVSLPESHFFWDLCRILVEKFGPLAGQRFADIVDVAMVRSLMIPLKVLFGVLIKVTVDHKLIQPHGNYS